MARSSQSDTESRRLAGLSGAKFTFRQESNQGTFRRKLVAYLSRFARHEWSVAILYLFLDIASWIAIYGIVGWLRYDAFYATPFQFFIIDLIQLAVIVQALYFIGGYDRAVEKRTLAYATEHLLAIIVASGVSALLIYSAATFDQTMKPSRAVLLLSFMIFLPVSLFYRRWIQKYVAAGDINRAFLVIGSGPAAVRFYEAYQRSPNSQQLHFVDLGGQRAGQRIAGEASPVVEGDIASRLDDLGEHYSGIILAENVSSLGARLLERLVRTQFYQTRVYTL